MVNISVVVVIVISWITLWQLDVVKGTYGAGYIAARLLLQGNGKDDVLNDPCHGFTLDPIQCRQKKCNYDCGNGHCSKDKSGCSAVSGCADSCYDICSCRGQGCQYNVAQGYCRNYTDIVCRASQFLPRDCARKDARYSFGGEICWHKGERGDCSMEKVILAVNLQGESHEDVNGIKYQGWEEVDRDDPFRLIANATSKQYSGRPAEDRRLYTTIMSANSKGHTPNQCVSYMVPICQDGNYELSLKLIEAHFTEAGKRHFTVKFANQAVFPEIDLFSLAGGRYIAFDLNINFYVWNNYIVSRGFSKTPIPPGGLVPLQFCISECKNSYVKKFYVSGFSVIKLKEGVLLQDSGSYYC